MLRQIGTKDLKINQRDLPWVRRHIHPEHLHSNRTSEAAERQDFDPAALGKTASTAIRPERFAWQLYTKATRVVSVTSRAQCFDKVHVRLAVSIIGCCAVRRRPTMNKVCPQTSFSPHWADLCSGLPIESS